ncbi:hypothetical protein BJ508DRAFT_306035 [Ascobolus immersus RN42]|uniref:Uncharacterized protein n=1 Tax=Ascobolus immersus RN42 TaxID=1160509 RepID=A0A3N4I9K4_ASCIM|nr:hypothetical protein BJ508DRAFT_306035 [Ascobolus immersus RN42]
MADNSEASTNAECPQGHLHNGRICLYKVQKQTGEQMGSFFFNNEVFVCAHRDDTRLIAVTETRWCQIKSVDEPRIRELLRDGKHYVRAVVRQCQFGDLEGGKFASICIAELQVECLNGV